MLVHIRPVFLRFDHSLDPPLGNGVWPVLCPTTALTVGPPSAQSPFAQCGCDPHWGDAPSVSSEDITPPFASTDSFASHSGLFPTSVYGLVGGVFAGCLPAPAARRTFPTLSLRIFPWMPDPVPRRYHSVPLPVSSAVSSAFPHRDWGRLPANCPLETTSCGPEISERQIFLYVQASKFVLPPRSSLLLRILPQGSRGFYVRAEHASSPPHAPDMLTVRIQAIDGTRTFTLPDPQPCRLLPWILR